MKFIRTFLITLAALILSSSVTFYFAVQIKGKALAEEFLQAYAGSDASLGAVEADLFFGIYISDVRLPGRFEVERLYAALGLPEIKERKIVLRRVQLLAPVWVVHRGKDGILRTGTESSRAVAEAGPLIFSGRRDSGAGPLRGWLIQSLEVEGGTLFLTDHLPGQEMDLKARQIALKLRGVCWPLASCQGRFGLAMTLEGTRMIFSGSRVWAEGWVDLAGRNMDAYARVIEPGEALEAVARFFSRDNVLEVKGVISVMSAQIEDRRLSHNLVGLGGLVAGLAKSSGVEASIGFDFETRMDAFRFGPVRFEGQLVYDEDKASESLKEDFRRIAGKFGDLGKKYYPAARGSRRNEALDE